jgi:uncharacterized delta-60 repeat protein
MAVETSFGHWLQRRRKALDLTQEQLAQRVGCAAETLRKIEADVRRPSRQIAERLAEALEIPELERAVFIKAARAELAVDRLKPPTQDVAQVALVPAKVLSSEAVSFLFTQITPTLQTKPFDGRCPYKGLDVFEEEDANLFFGREKLVEDLIGRLKESRTVFMIGPSGSGKSSLVRAGLIHTLKQGAIKNLHSERWLYETMKPGRDPIGELARVISSMAGTTKAGDELRESGLNGNSILAQWCEIALKEGRDKRAFLFIDQFEEIFTQVSNEEERLIFLNLLTHAATAKNGRVIVLFAMRSDFVMNCATYSQLNALFNQQSIQIGAMEANELVNAIAQPVLSVGLPIDRDLVAQIINDMQGEPGALPLMQFALKGLFDSQQAKGGRIDLTLNDYLQQGGIHKSLQRHADDSFAKLQDQEQEIARSIFSGLIEIGRGTQDTRRTALFDELIPSDSKAADVRVVIQKLADARLVTTNEEAGKDTVTISHEKLIDAWPWLKKLVDENRETIALQNEIARDAQDWQNHQRELSYLYTGTRLANARKQLKSKKLVLSGLAHDFVEQGVNVLADELESSRQRATQLRKRSTYLFVALVAALIAVGFAVFFSIQTRKQTQLVLARQLAAQAQSIIANSNQRQMIADLLAAQSMKLFSTGDAAQILLNNNFAARSIVNVTHDGSVTDVAFSPSGQYAISASCDTTDSTTNNCIRSSVRVWEAISGKEIYRLAHGSFVSSAAFSPDGKYILSVPADGSFHVWEAATGKEIAHIIHGDSVTSIAFSPQSKWIVSGGCNTACTQGVVRVWEVSTGKEVARMIDSAVNAVTFSSDSKYVVSGSSDGTARVWEAATGKEVASMSHESRGIMASPIVSVAFSPDNKYVATGSVDYTARIWELTTGKEIARMTHEAEVNSIAFSPTGKYVVSGSYDKTARVWETATGKEVARMTHGGFVDLVTFSPDGKYVVSGSYDKTARVWETATGKEVARMTHNNRVTSAAFSPDGKYVISGSDDKTARVWQPSNGMEVARINNNFLGSFALSPDGKYVATGSDDKTARVWEVITGKEVVRMTHDGLVYSLAFSSDGKYVATGSDDKTARVWEVITGKEVARMTHDDFVGHIAFSPNGKYIVTGTGEHDYTARVWELSSGKEVVRKVHKSSAINIINDAVSVAFSPDGKYVVSVGCDEVRNLGGLCRISTALVWEAANGKEATQLTHDGFVEAIVFSPDGKYVAIGSSDKTVCVWEVSTGKELARMLHDSRVLSIAFSSDGKYVVSGSDDKTARVWEVITGKEVVRMIHDSWVLSVAFSSDGKYVVSASDDNTARVWEASTGRELARMIHDDVVSSVAFGADGRYVISGSLDNTIRVWFWQAYDLISTACKYLPRNLSLVEWKQYVGDTLPYQAICPNLPIEPRVTPGIS